MRNQRTPGATSMVPPGAGGAPCGKLSAGLPPSWRLSGCGTGWIAGSDTLEDGGDALADANAHADQGIAALAPMQLADRREREARAGGAERMSHGNGAAIGIDPRIVLGKLQQLEA